MKNKSYKPEHHHEPPKPEPKNRKREARTAEAGNWQPKAAGTQSRTAAPKPTARAAEPHEPEPKPRNEADGTTPEGQAVEGKTTNKPEEAATH